jgi:hypothetical protein
VSTRSATAPGTGNGSEQPGANPTPPTLREMATTVQKLLLELRRIAEQDLATRSADPAERETVAAELTALQAEEEALLARLVRLEALVSAPAAADRTRTAETPPAD